MLFSETFGNFGSRHVYISEASEVRSENVTSKEQKLGLHKSKTT